MYANNQDENQLAKNLAIRGVGFFARKVLSPILSSILAALAPVILILLLAMFAYSAIFLLPQQLMEESSGTNTVIFSADDEIVTSWSKEKDQELYARYIQLTGSWVDELDNFQQEQAEDYALSWAVLAAVDRIIGDPSINLEIKEETDYMPQPEYHYDILKPIFKWKDSTITRVITWTESVVAGLDSEGNPYYATETKERTETEEVKLLVEANTFEALYNYSYETQTNTWTEGDKTITETKEVVKSISEQGPYYQRLISILDKHELESYTLEMVLELASVYDSSYQHSFETRWLGVNSLSLDFSQTYFHGVLGEMIWPLSEQYSSISSDFGYRIHPIRKKRSFHTGIDMPAPKGTPVFAVSDGYVRFSGKSGANGEFILIEHGDGILTGYAHLSKRKVRVGEIVKLGSVIGEVGSTGLSTGPHLHFEVRKIVDSKINYLDPKDFYK